MILAGDIGGTKTTLALFRAAGSALEKTETASYPSRRYPSFESILEEFLAGRPRVGVACIGVAGPVLAGQSRLTNLPWVVTEEGLRRACKAPRGFLINDLQATAFSVPFLPAEGFAVLQDGVADPEGPVAVVAAGTGLGVAFLMRSGRGYLPHASEGGHVDFPPRNGQEDALLERLRKTFGRVSVERVVSGPGLAALYRFLRESEGLSEPEEISQGLSGAGEELPRRIAEEGLSGRSPACKEALRLFVSLYGATAGNVALQLLATGGVVLGGGIAPAILPALSSGAFLAGFREKGRFSGLMEKIPVRVILDDTAALLGAARYAQAMEGQDE